MEYDPVVDQTAEASDEQPAFDSPVQPVGPDPDPVDVPEPSSGEEAPPEFEPQPHSPVEDDVSEDPDAPDVDRPEEDLTADPSDEHGLGWIPDDPQVEGD